MKDKIAKKFLGTNIDDSFEKIIITNIYSVYNGIIQNSILLKRDNGFYENSLIELKGKFFRIIKITPGNVIIDVLRLFKSVARDIVLVGLVGSLDDNFQVGDIVVPTVSSIIGSKDKFEFAKASSGYICQVDGLIHDREFYLNIADNGFNFIDMESNYLSSFGYENKIACRLIGIVSDNPITKPFYKIENLSAKLDCGLIIEKIIA